MRTWQAHKGGVMTLAFSPDGRALVSAGSGERNLAVWDALGGRRLRGIAPPPESLLGDAIALPTCLAFSADSRHLAVGYGGVVGVTEWQRPGAAWANRRSLVWPRRLASVRPGARGARRRAGPLVRGR